MMILKNRLLVSFWAICSFCSAQVAPNSSENAYPTVIRNLKTAGLAPDFDTTLVSQYIRSIFQDSKGNLWFGTIGEGVVRYNTKTRTYFSTSEGFNSQSVFAINEDKMETFGLEPTKACISTMPQLQTESFLGSMVKKMD